MTSICIYILIKKKYVANGDVENTWVRVGGLATNWPTGETSAQGRWEQIIDSDHLDDRDDHGE